MHSPIAVADLQTDQIAPGALDGLLIGDAIRQFAFSDPAVQAIASMARYSKKQILAFESLSGRGFFLWPLHSSADDLARILYPETRIARDEEIDMGEPPEKVMKAAKTISDFLIRIVKFLVRRDLLAHDEKNNEFDRWQCSGLAIDVRMSDRWDIGRPNSELLRKSLMLSLPVKTAGSSIANASDGKPKKLRSWIDNPKMAAVHAAWEKHGLGDGTKANVRLTNAKVVRIIGADVQGYDGKEGKVTEALLKQLSRYREKRGC
jgi:hypothetical protein